MTPTAPVTLPGVRPFRFAILGTGNIARQFAEALPGSRRCRVVAVGSRRPESARAFVDAYAPGAACDSYDGVLGRDDVDAVYVSLPNTLHHPWTLRALRAGKHVLCEKPLAMSAAEAEEMFDAARSAGRLLVEAFMYVSHPLHRATADRLRSGEIGRIRHVRTSFCFRSRKIDGNVRFDRSLGGGALLDVGCYCVHFSRWVAAIAAGTAEAVEPAELWATAVRHAPTGVDELVAGAMRFAHPQGTDLTATFACGLSLQADNTATVSGEDGYLELPVPWKPPVTDARLVIAHATPPRQDQMPPPPPPGTTTPAFAPPVAARHEQRLSVDRPLYALEADDFADAADGLRPPAVTPADSLANARTLDRLRRLIGD